MTNANDNEKFVHNTDNYKMVDALPQLAKADLSNSNSGCCMSELLSQNTQCCKGFKKS